MSDIILRYCKKCQHDYPPTLEHFYADSRYKSGFRSPCKHCIQEYDEPRKEHIQTYNQRYYQENAKKIKHDRQVYRQTHPEQIRQYNQMYVTANAERVSLYFRDYASTHVETIKPYQQAYRPVYRAKNRDKINTNTRNRRARKKAVPGTHTAQEIRQQYDRQKGKCYYCGKKVKWGDHWIDHTFPISREFARNSIDHLVITCEPCNESKGNKYPWEWPQGNRLL